MGRDKSYSRIISHVSPRGTYLHVSEPVLALHYRAHRVAVFEAYRFFAQTDVISRQRPDLSPQLKWIPSTLSFCTIYIYIYVVYIF